VNASLGRIGMPPLNAEDVKSHRMRSSPRQASHGRKGSADRALLPLPQPDPDHRVGAGEQFPPDGVAEDGLDPVDVQVHGGGAKARDLARVLERGLSL
jgi:hypothetical protein